VVMNPCEVWAMTHSCPNSVNNNLDPLYPPAHVLFVALPQWDDDLMKQMRKRQRVSSLMDPPQCVECLKGIKSYPPRQLLYHPPMGGLQT
jgi:hypothetical protein